MDIEHFDGIVKIDETYFLYSQKGQRGITERKPHIKELLLTSFVFEMTETYDSLRLSKFIV